MHTVKFEYSTQIELLIMPEYGRNVQDLVNHCRSLEDPTYRQSFAEGIVDLMQIMTPYNKNLDEHRKKLWHHFFRIAEYNIGVVPPAGVDPKPENDRLNPIKVDYPLGNEKFRHYGNYVNSLIAKASEIEDDKKKLEFGVLIGEFMKTAFSNWNRDHYVTDDIIKNDLKIMSKGKIILPDEITLDVQSSTSHRAFKKPTMLMKNKKRKNKKSTGSHNMNNRRY